MIAQLLRDKTVEASATLQDGQSKEIILDSEQVKTIMQFAPSELTNEVVQDLCVKANS